MATSQFHSSHVEISRAALFHNIRQFRILIGPRRKFLAVVKSNAYGHGIDDVSRIAMEGGVDWLGVNSLDEGLRLRLIGIQAPILILGYVPWQGLEQAVANDFRMVVYNAETIDRLSSIARKLKKVVPLHVKVETGTYRQGVGQRQILGFVGRILKHPELKVEGLTSHFANIEDTTNFEYPRRQLEIFKTVCDMLNSHGIHVPLKHMSCTAAAMLFPETYFNLVRIGIGLYGIWPSKETMISFRLGRRRPLSLSPVLTWKARIVQIKTVPKDALIGYGGTYRTSRRTVLAVISVGYFEGYDRGLSNAAYVLIRGRRAAVIGRVAMNFLTADVTEIPDVVLEDEAVLIGKSGREQISAGTVASLAGTIAYEILARINPQIPRVVI